MVWTRISRFIPIILFFVCMAYILYHFFLYGALPGNHFGIPFNDSIIANNAVEINDSDFLRYNSMAKRFDKKWLPYLKYFGLLTRTSTPEEQILLSSPVFVTAISDNHFIDGMAFLSQFNETISREKPPDFHLYLYDLGVRPKHMEKLRRQFGHLVTVRRFPFELFPEYVSNLREYRWKPLVIADVLRTHSSTWWMDASIKIKSLIDLRIGYADLRTCALSHMNMDQCIQYPFTFVWPAGHSIYAASNPGMYSYFPVNYEAAKYTPMMGIGIIVVFGTDRVKNEVIRWWILCALEEECIGPVGHRLECDWEEERYKKYLKCHRYEQSAGNILIAMANNYNLGRYTRLGSPGFDVRRLQ